jgi:hypothetical protein
MALPREFLKSATGIVALTLSLVGAGFLVCGVVLAVAAAVASGMDAHEGVRYEYQAGGSTYVGSEITWEKPDAYEPGANVAVVYDAAKGYRSALKRPHGEV